jgi:hypothetical protein
MKSVVFLSKLHVTKIDRFRLPSGLGPSSFLLPPPNLSNNSNSINIAANALPITPFMNLNHGLYLLQRGSAQGKKAMGLPSPTQNIERVGRNWVLYLCSAG